MGRVQVVRFRSLFPHHDSMSSPFRKCRISLSRFILSEKMSGAFSWKKDLIFVGPFHFSLAMKRHECMKMHDCDQQFAFQGIQIMWWGDLKERMLWDFERFDDAHFLLQPAVCHNMIVDPSFLDILLSWSTCLARVDRSLEYSFQDCLLGFFASFTLQFDEKLIA